MRSPSSPATCAACSCSRRCAGKRVLAIDPGFRTGCKVAVLDETGNLLEHAVDSSAPAAEATRGSPAQARRAGPQASGRRHRDRQRHGLPGHGGVGRRSDRRIRRPPSRRIPAAADPNRRRRAPSVVSEVLGRADGGGRPAGRRTAVAVVRVHIHRSAAANPQPAADEAGTAVDRPRPAKGSR